MKKLLFFIMLGMISLTASNYPHTKHLKQPFYINSNIQDAGVVNQLVGAIADQLTQNKDFKDIKNKSLAVTSFVCLDNLKATSRLSNIVSENLLHEMQVRGYRVIDFKTMQSISVGKYGDFIFSRDTTKLRQSLDLNYILTGTYTSYRSGIAINARIIDLKTHVILSTAQIFIPKKISRFLEKSQREIEDFTPNKVQLHKQ
ncbi:MAG: FlgO family outer membrane protein [Campylobacterota bacterium]|nr:FlgO family outer membrane protein [Campylobacterota bacterium]